MSARRCPRDAGAAVVEFALVSVLLIFLFLGIVQVALLMHVRDVLVADAAEGARYAANRGVGLAGGVDRCEQFVYESLSAALVGPTTCQARWALGADGLRLAEMTVDAEVPLTVLPFGHVHLAVLGRAIAEPS